MTVKRAVSVSRESPEKTTLPTVPIGSPFGKVVEKTSLVWPAFNPPVIWKNMATAPLDADTSTFGPGVVPAL